MKPKYSFWHWNRVSLALLYQEHKGTPEYKPVDASYYETGSG